MFVRGVSMSVSSRLAPVVLLLRVQTVFAIWQIVRKPEQTKTRVKQQQQPPPPPPPRHKQPLNTHIMLQGFFFFFFFFFFLFT
jgi:hypothetical protein